MTLDDLRVHHPELGFAVYAFEPGGDVTLEIHTPEGSLFTFVAGSLADAVQAAFPSPPAPVLAAEPADDLFA